MHARCPAGQVTHKTKKARDEKGRRIRMFVFDEAACSVCRLRDRCVRGNKPRTIRIGYPEKKRMAIKECEKTPEFKEKYRTRAYVERAIAWLTSHGTRQAWYIGAARVRFQLQMIAAVHNIVALYRKLAAKAVTAGAAAG